MAILDNMLEIDVANLHTGFSLLRFYRERVARSLLGLPRNASLPDSAERLRYEIAARFATQCQSKNALTEKEA